MFRVGFSVWKYFLISSQRKYHIPICFYLHSAINAFDNFIFKDIKHIISTAFGNMEIEDVEGIEDIDDFEVIQAD